MSAPNFSTSHNSRHIYAFCMEGYDEYKAQYIKDTYEDEDEVPANLDEWLSYDWYRMEKDYYLEWLKEELNKKFGDIYVDDDDPCDGQTFVTIYRRFTFANYKWDLEMHIDLEAGYYEGFKLDWHVAKCEYLDFTDCLPDADDCRDMLYFQANKNEGLSRMLAAKLANRFEKEVKEVGDAISDCLDKVCPTILEGTVLSNGEGWYHRVKIA